MKVVPVSAGALSAFTIHDAPSAPNRGVMDPVTVITQDLGGSKGRLLVECFGRAWSCYWGAMGCSSTREFIRTSHPGYVLNCLLRANHEVITSDRVHERDEAYLGRIVEAIYAALRAGVPAPFAPPCAGCAHLSGQRCSAPVMFGDFSCFDARASA